MTYKIIAIANPRYSHPQDKNFIDIDLTYVSGDVASVPIQSDSAPVKEGEDPPEIQFEDIFTPTSDEQTVGFTYHPGDTFGEMPALVGQWFKDNPGVVIADYISPLASTDPSHYQLTDIQLRLGLINAVQAGALPDTFLPDAIDDKIKTIPDMIQKQTLKTYWERSTVINWNDPIFQQFITLMGTTPEALAPLWISAAAIKVS